MNVNTTSKLVKHTRIRFSYEDDILLLTEFISQNPLEKSGAWEIIQQHLLSLTKKIYLIM